MPSSILSKYKICNEMNDYLPVFKNERNHLKYLLEETDRLQKYSLYGGGIFFDFSHQRIDENIFRMLVELSKEAKLLEKFSKMAEGEIVNVTEGRAALHTAARSFSKRSFVVKEEKVMASIEKVRKEMELFSKNVHEQKIKGSTGKPFRHLVIVGIGGSYLGTMFVSKALEYYAIKGMSIDFLTNVDIHDFGRIVSRIDPESTLWIIISKSYTTAETVANTNQIIPFMKERGLDPSRHIVTVTSKGSPGDQKDLNFLKTFHMFDFIGGRYSVTSAVGGVPLSLYIGYDNFEKFLKGAELMDIHAENASPEKNIPMIAALISVWNFNFLNYPHSAIIPYAMPLEKLPPHIQQLNMESNGKSTDISGNPIDPPTGTIIFGETGTNAQHSFFQLAHQGKPFPIEFIGVIHPQYQGFGQLSMGVTNHQELWANLLAQRSALAKGKESHRSERSFAGNRPSSTIIVDDLSPESVGGLLAFYEAKTVYEAFIWGINPFDQYGVELGKVMAADIRSQMAKRNSDPGYSFLIKDEGTNFYLNRLYEGSIQSAANLCKEKRES